MASFVQAHKVVAKSEGGYTNNPKDRGNYVDGELVGTNFGISAPILKTYLGRKISVDDMINISPKDVATIYKKNYWDKIEGDLIKNQSIALMLYDAIVNQGSGATRSMVKNALQEQKIPYDGIEASSINKANQKKFYKSIYNQRLQRYEGGQKEFREGWIKRLNDLSFVPTNRNKVIIISASILVLVGVSFYLIQKSKK